MHVSRWASWALPLALGLAFAPAALEARGGKGEPKGGAPKSAGPVELKGAPIRDLATTISVPVSAELSLVLPLPPRFWVQCPRHLPVPTSLAGRGLIAQYLNERGGSVSMLYAGCVPLGGAFEGDKPTSRAERAASDFVVMLADKYKRVDWVLTNAPVTVAPVTIKVAGKKTAAWSTSRITTHPGEYGGPESVFQGEGLLFQPEGSDVLAYVLLDAKAGGTTLDKAIAGLDVKPTRGLHPAGRRLQINDLFISSDGRFPVRLLALDLPPGFVPTPVLDDMKGEWVYAEERLPASGPADATLRIEHRPVVGALSAEQVARELHALWPEAERSPLEAIDTDTRGHQAWHFAHPSPRDGEAARALCAVFRLDDQILTLTWACRGGAAQEAKDRPLFLAMLGSIEMAVRW
jgi:hypothetical protein